MADFTLLDGAAFAWFLIAWLGYNRFADRPRTGLRTLARAVEHYRYAWMQRMLRRDNRIVDIAIVGNITRSIGFFASTTILILAGLIAILGATDKLMLIVNDLPFSVPASKLLWDSKLLLLITIFVYAFFKFTWSLRQYNYTSMMIGAAPLGNEEGYDLEEYARRVAGAAARGTEHFNQGIRGYYFGLAALSWFIHAWLLIIVSAWIVCVLFRREFRSRTLKDLQGGEAYLYRNDPSD